MNYNKSVVTAKLLELDLSADAANAYLELLRESATHLRLSRLTGINRTKIYRVVEALEKRGLVTRSSDDRGTFLVAHDPATLEINLTMQEEKIKHQRAVFDSIIPVLSKIKAGDSRGFAVHTYEGTEGIKQLLWHELKAEGELLVLGKQTLEDLGVGRRWAEKHRDLTLEAGYRIREIINDPYLTFPFSDNEAYMNTCYIGRHLPADVLPLETPIVIYNSTVVTIYHRDEQSSLGVEIISDSFAATMRQVFEHYWQLAKPCKHSSDSN